MATQRNKRLARIARNAARIMSQKKSWCQGYWATAGKPGQHKDALQNEINQACGVDGWGEPLCGIARAHYIAANSPKAVKFCVEGAVMRAAGREFKTLAAGLRAANDVINALDATLVKNKIIKNKIIKGPGESAVPVGSCQELNDHNGDKSRRLLVENLREAAKGLA